MPSKGQYIFYRKKKRMDQVIGEFPDNTQYWLTDGPNAKDAIILDQFASLIEAMKVAVSRGNGTYVIRANLTSEECIGMVRNGRYIVL